MRSSVLFGAFSGALLLAGNAYAQSPAPAPPASADRPVTTAAPVTRTPMAAGSMWRSSKMIGVDVYNSSNEKLGDISEVLLDTSGGIAGYVIGVGGFLGMGQHDIMVTPGKLKFVNEPMRTTAAATTTTDRTATGSTTMTATTPAQPARAAEEKWYPDHAVMAATKDELKAMPEFKYSSN
jgi:sporulation protein YlmC with PRC-barrel domain